MCLYPYLYTRFYHFLSIHLSTHLSTQYVFTLFYFWGVLTKIYHILELNHWPYLSKLWLFKPYLISIYTIFEWLLKSCYRWPYFAHFIFNLYSIKFQLMYKLFFAPRWVFPWFTTAIHRFIKNNSFSRPYIGNKP